MSNNRIYSILACEVVPKMLVRDMLIGISREWVPVDRCYTYGLKRVIVFGGTPKPGTSPWSYVLLPTDLIDVQLPGLSPRLLCSCCNGDGCGDTQEVHDYQTAPWHKHSKHCLVYYLRLRLWPVGTSWDPISKCWLLGSIAVSRADVKRAFAPYLPSDARVLRAAFCESADAQI